MHCLFIKKKKLKCVKLMCGKKLDVQEKFDFEKMIKTTILNKSTHTHIYMIKVNLNEIT